MSKYDIYVHIAWIHLRVDNTTTAKQMEIKPCAYFMRHKALCVGKYTLLPWTSWTSTAIPYIHVEQKQDAKFHCSLSGANVLK